jgi:hypothetical protein
MLSGDFLNGSVKLQNKKGAMIIAVDLPLLWTKYDIRQAN